MKPAPLTTVLVALTCLVAACDDPPEGVPQKLYSDCADYFRADQGIPGGFDNFFDMSRAESFAMTDASDSRLRAFGTKAASQGLVIHVILFPRRDRELTGPPGSRERISASVPCFVAEKDGDWRNVTETVSRSFRP